MVYDNLLFQQDISFTLFQDLLKKENSLIKELRSNQITLAGEKTTIEAGDSELQQNDSSNPSILERNNGWLNNDFNFSSTESHTSIGCNCANCCGYSVNRGLVLESSPTTLESAVTFDSSLSQNIIDTLLTGYQWTSSTITYSFYENDVFHGEYDGSETGVKEVSQKVKENVREILDLVETFIDVDFVEVEETNRSTYGQIRYMLSDNPGYAYAYLPFPSNDSDSRPGDVHLRSAYDHSNNLNGFQNDPGKHGYTTLIHETFHALGLDHPHERNVLDAKKDNSSNTVMTYDSKGNSPGTAMPYDIAALQQLYGVAENNNGNDTYVFGSTTDVFTVNGESSFTTTHRIKQTIWDSNGIDTLDFSALESQSSGYLFDLNEGGWLVANSQDRTNSSGERYYNYGTSLAYGMTIENIVNSSSNDTIIANDAINTFSGYEKGVNSGNDTLVNTDKSDTLDLSAYKSDEVTQTKSGNNLVIDLGSDGSIAIKDYYATAETSRLNILWQSTPDEPTDEPDDTTRAIAEVGKINNLDHNGKTITLQNDYTNPVVFAQPLSSNEAAPAIVRITNIDAGNDTISFAVQEAEYEDGIHIAESFSYMVIEAGTWQLADGSLLEVGTLDTAQINNHKWQSIDFDRDFSQTPVILSQVQTNNDTEFVRTRQKSANSEGFLLKMEKEQALKSSGHGEETIGWLAIDSGSGNWNGLQYQADNTGRNVKQDWYSLDLDDFATIPNLLGSIATTYGGDSSGLRYREISGADGSTIQIKIEEDQSFDEEIKHTREDVNFLAIAGSGSLTAQPYNDLVSSSLTGDTVDDVFAAVEVDMI